jgi:hypothetical protein
MLKKLGFSAVLTLILIAAFGALAPTSSAGQTAVANSGTRRLEFRSHGVQEDFIDVGAKGDSPGDYSVFYDELLKQGKKVGTDGGTCTIVHIASSGGATTAVTVQCLVTASLRAGQLTIQGLTTFPATGTPKPFTLAVTGGTGAYKGAGGEATVTQVNDTDSDVVVVLTR